MPPPTITGDIWTESYFTALLESLSYLMDTELRLLGGVSVVTNGQVVSGAAAQPRRIAVLAILADSCPLPVTRERLIALLWPEHDEAGARRLLTQAVYELRRELGAVVIATGRDLALDPSLLTSDLVEFRRAARDDDPARAVDLYRGPFLDGVHLRDAGEFERWSASVRDRCERDLRWALDALVTRSEAAGDFREAARWAEQRVEASPYDASHVLHAVDLLERIGDLGGVSRVAATYSRRMREDLELEPDAEVVSRVSRVGQPAVRPAQSTEPAPTPLPLPRAAAVQTTRKTPPSAPAAASGHRRWMLPIAAAVAVALLAIPALRQLRHRPVSNAVAIVPFDARGDSASARAAASLAPLLLANLDGAGGVRVDTAAAGAGPHRSLSGTIIAEGSQLRLDAELTPASDGAPDVRVSVTAPRDSVVLLAERLSLELLPALYSNLDAAAHRPVVRTLANLPAARNYLDGESALKRAAFDSAFASLRSATAADSSHGYLWYRRAIAAEEAHHIEDADESAALADARGERLSEGDRALVHAYHVWRLGNTCAADSLYRELLRQRPLGAEEWFQFAEVAYHGGALIGHSLDAARDAWRKVVALDSSNFPALMHAVRMEARAGDTRAVRALLARAESVQAREPYLSEARAIAAAGGTPSTLPADVLRSIDTMPDASVQFVHAIIAGLIERPDLAWPIATRLTRPGRPAAVRAEGYAALAHLALSRGQVQVAGKMLDTLSQQNATEAAWWRSYFATLPFMPADSNAARDAMQALAITPSRATSAPLTLDLSVNAPVAEVIQRYSTALLAARRGQRMTETLGCGTLASPSARDLCDDLERGLRAEAAMRRGDDGAALRELQAMTMRVPYQLAGRSVYFARTRERFLRAQLLERAGHLSEAYDWYAGVPHGGRLDYVYLAASHLGRARIRERQGDRPAAAAHYQSASQLLAQSDGLMGLRDAARAGLERTAR